MRLPIQDAAPHPLPARGRTVKALTTCVLAPVSLGLGALHAVAGRSRRLDPAAIRSIAFIKLDHLGDALMAAPLLRALKRWAPAARLDVWARPPSADLLRRYRFVDDLLEADVPWIRPGTGMRANLAACRALAGRIHARRYDLAIDLRYHNRLDSLLLSLCGARATLGFDAGGFGFGITHRAPWPMASHEVDRMADALRTFGVPVRELRPEFPVTAAERNYSRRAMGAGRYAAIHPGAGNAIKRWMPERFAWVAKELVRRAGLRIAVLAGPGEERAADACLRAVPAGRATDLRGALSFGRMAAVIRGAQVFVGNDGGAAHLAAAVGTPAVVVFSGTNEASQWAPRGERVAALEHRVPCKPCARTDCPFDQACLRGVSVDAVLRESLRLLQIKT